MSDHKLLETFENSR